MSILVYLLEDDLDITRLIERSLAQQGFAVRSFRRLSDFERALRTKLPDLCLIDLSLPDGDGLSLLNSGLLPRTVPRVVVTGRGSITDRVVGLEIGADDYIVKPFETREMVARLRAVMRRCRMNRDEDDGTPKAIAHFGDWTANITACTLARASGESVSLSSSENALLEAFLRAPGRVLTRSNLLDATTGRCNEPFDRSMDARICRLRRKLGDNPRSPDIIRTVYGAGYIFAKDVSWLE